MKRMFGNDEIRMRNDEGMPKPKYESVVLPFKAGAAAPQSKALRAIRVIRNVIG